MKRLTVDTDLPFCDIAKCDFIPGGSFCEDGRCDQRRCYEKLREYERSNLEPETLRKAQGLLKELKDARKTVELMDACGKRVCSSEEHWGCPYGNEGMTDCAVLLEAAYEDTIEKLLALKETLEGYPVDGMQEGFAKFLEHMTWKNSFSLSREIVEDAKLMDLKKQPAGFITSYYRTREKFGAALIGAAVQKKTETTFSGKTFNVKTADGKCLFATNHPSKLGKSNQSNQFSDAFSNDALMAMEAKMQDFRGDNDEVLDVAPTTILIPNDYKLKRDVFAAIGADKDPATANNGFNYNFGRWNVVVWPYLNQFIASGTAPWILLDKKYNDEYGSAMWLDRVQLEVRSELAGNDANVWKGYARFIAGFNDWRGYAVGGVTGGTQLIATSTGG